jgi:hypothetical protein
MQLSQKAYHHKSTGIMAFGTLIWWNPDRGFGFIRPDEDGPDMFPARERA